jgi:mannosyltransferase
MSRQLIFVIKRHGLLGLFLLIGTALRLYDLDFWSLWADEIHTLWRADRDIGGTIELVKNSPFPPLYYLFMNVWFKIFSVTDYLARLPSVIFSVGTFIVYYILVLNLFNRKVALISAAFVIINPFQIEMAQNAKMYPMLWFFILLSLFYLWRIIHQSLARDWILYVLTSIIAVYTLYIGWIAIALHNLLYLFFIRGKKIRKWVFAQAIILIAYLPWYYYFIINSIKKTGILWIRWPENYLIQFKDTFSRFMGFLYYDNVMATDLISLFVGILIVVGILQYKNSLKPVKFILIWIFFTYLVFYLVDLTYTPILDTRYLSLLCFPLAVLLALGIDSLPRFIGTTSLAIVFGFMILFPLKSYLGKTSKYYLEDWRTMIRDVGGLLSEKQEIINKTYLDDSALLYIIKHYWKSNNLTILNRYTNGGPFQGDEIITLYRDNKKYPFSPPSPTYSLLIHRRFPLYLEYVLWVKKGSRDKDL